MALHLVQPSPAHSKLVDKALLARASHEVPVRQDLTAIRLGQACHDVEERYMSLESLSALSDDPVLRLPAVAA